MLVQFGEEQQRVWRACLIGKAERSYGDGNCIRVFCLSAPSLEIVVRVDGRSKPSGLPFGAAKVVAGERDSLRALSARDQFSKSSHRRGGFSPVETIVHGIEQRNAARPQFRARWLQRSSKQDAT